MASTYTLKNSKRYRNAWAQQVRSMMGTAVEGPDQGVVRFAIEIAPKKPARPQECPDLPTDTVEAEAADMQRQFDMWESGRLDQRK